MSKRLGFYNSTKGGSYGIGWDFNYGDKIIVACCEEEHVLFYLKIVINEDGTFVLHESSDS